MAMCDTITRMGKKKTNTDKAPPSEDRHRDPRIVLHLENDLLEALDEYKESLAHDPGRSQIVRDCIREFLRLRGFYPPKN